MSKEKLSKDLKREIDDFFSSAHSYEEADDFVGGIALRIRALPESKEKQELTSHLGGKIESYLGIMHTKGLSEAIH